MLNLINLRIIYYKGLGFGERIRLQHYNGACVKSTV